MQILQVTGLKESRGWVDVVDETGEVVGHGLANPHSSIAVRLVDSRDVTRLLADLLAMREATAEMPYYRLLHGDAAGGPGVTIDRLGRAVLS